MSEPTPLMQHLDILYESGAKLCQTFAEEQLALQRRQEEAKEEADGGDAKERDAQELEALSASATRFDHEYQRWYGISLTLMKQYAPERYVEFQAYYQADPKRDEVQAYNYTIQDWFRFRAFDEDTQFREWSVVVRCFMNQLTILKAVRDRLEWQTLSTQGQSDRAIQLELLETARGLIGINERASGALAGTILHGFLSALAAKYRLKFRKNVPDSRELVEALKTGKFFDVPIWSQAAWLAEIHERSISQGEPPTKVQVRDLIDGTRWLISNVF